MQVRLAVGTLAPAGPADGSVAEQWSTQLAPQAQLLAAAPEDEVLAELLATQVSQSGTSVSVSRLGGLAAVIHHLRVGCSAEVCLGRVARQSRLLKQRAALIGRCVWSGAGPVAVGGTGMR